MSTATKLEYLNTTKEKIRDSINLTGANIGTSDTFRSYASKLKKGYIDIINNGTDNLYSNFPKVSGIGSNLSLTPTYEAPMKLNEIQGDTLQENTPTPDSPVPIQSVTGNQKIKVTGKNLVDFSNLQTNSNTTYTWQNDILEVKATTGTYNRVYIDITSLYKNNPGKTLRFDYETLDFSQGVSSSVNLQIVKSGTNTYVELVDNSGTIITRTIPNDTSEITQVLLRVVCNNTNTSQASQISITKPILHFGNIATTYEPYTGNTYEVNLGKNLFDINGTFTGNLIKYNNGFQLIKNSTNRTINYLPSSPIPKGTYTLSYEIVSSTLSDVNKLLIQFFNADNTNILTKTLSSTGSLNCILTEDVTKIYFYISNSEETDTQITFDNIQLEKGTQSTSFSPYFTPIELNKIGDYQDRIYKDNGKWYVEKQIGKVVLDGSENGFLISSNDNGYLFGISSKTFPLENYSTNYISNYSLANSTSISTTANIGSYIYNNIFRMRVPSTIATTFDNFKTWLSTHNTEVLYVLATPTYTEITNTELIEDLETLYTAKSQEGTTNISITSEDLEMILNISALKGEV